VTIRRPAIGSHSASSPVSTIMIVGLTVSGRKPVGRCSEGFPRASGSIAHCCREGLGDDRNTRRTDKASGGGRGPIFRRTASMRGLWTREAGISPDEKAAPFALPPAPQSQTDDSSVSRHFNKKSLRCRRLLACLHPICSPSGQLSRGKPMRLDVFSRKLVLLVEDEPLIALDIEQH